MENWNKECVTVWSGEGGLEANLWVSIKKTIEESKTKRFQSQTALYKSKFKKVNTFATLLVFDQVKKKNQTRNVFASQGTRILLLIEISLKCRTRIRPRITGTSRGDPAHGIQSPFRPAVIGGIIHLEISRGYTHPRRHGRSISRSINRSCFVFVSAPG